MQTDPNLTFQMKLAGHIIIGEIEIQTEAKVPNVSLSSISEIVPFFGNLQPSVDEQFVIQLKAHGLYDQFIAKQASDGTCIHKPGCFSFSSIQQVNLTKSNDFEDISNDLPNSTP